MKKPLLILSVLTTLLFPLAAQSPSQRLEEMIATAFAEEDALSLYRCAQALESGWMNPSDTLHADPARAAQLFRRSAELDNADAQAYMGYLYGLGQGVKHDTDSALYWTQRAVDNGNAKAANNMGYMLAQGVGVQQDYEKAAYWFAKAAAMGLPVAMAQLGDLYRQGLGVEKDLVSATDYYTDAIEGGLADAELKLLSLNGNAYETLPMEEALRLGRLYWNLGGYRVANVLLQRAADQGSAEAKTLLGEAYSKAYGVPYDLDLSLRNFVDAAQANDPSAQFVLAELLDMFPDALTDYPEANDWRAVTLYELAGNQGVKDAETATARLLHGDQTFWLGADISGTTADEARGHFTRNKEGQPTETTQLMRDLGLNSVRLRVWKDPSATGGFSSPEDVLLMAKRAKDLGMDIMIDFHYSDWWADPGKQNPPRQWEGLSLEAMKDSLAQHTRATLQLLKDNDIAVEWVQVGNETTNGMLWPLAKLPEGMDAYAELTKAGYDAVKEVYPEAAVIVHLDNGFDRDLYDNVFDALKERGVEWDIIGMSVYPYWAMDGGKEPDAASTLRHSISNIRHLKNKYGTDVMVVETGFEASQPDEGYRQLSTLLEEARFKTGDACLGVWYWAPEIDAQAHYKLGAFSEGMPTRIMDAFTEFSRRP